MLATKTKVLNYLDLKIAATHAQEEGLSLPEPNHIDMYGTANNFGFMFGKFDQVVLDFLEEIESHNSKQFDILEVGCAYGNVAKEALLRGCKGYIASDVCEDHLKVLAKELVASNREDLSKKVKLLQGRFPEDIELPSRSIKFALMNKVLHFFQPNELSGVMDNIVRITAKGGKWFVLTVSPTTETFKDFAPEYARRKKIGVAYPGFCANAGEFSTDKCTSDNLPYSMFFMELADLCTLFESYGFRILKTYSLNMPTAENPNWVNGQDMVGVIAQKL